MSEEIYQKDRQKYSTTHGYSSEELFDLSERFIEYATRDLEFLSPMGITEAFLQNVSELANELKAIPTEEDDLETKTAATRKKKAARREGEDRIMMVRKQLSLYHDYIKNIKPSQYNRSVIGVKDDHFIGVYEKIRNDLRDNIEEYRPYGITEKVVADFEKGTEVYKEYKVLQDRTQHDGVFNANKRKEKRAKLYAYCKHISTLGKLYWKGRDEVKYKKYRITKPKKRGRKRGSV